METPKARTEGRPSRITSWIAANPSLAVGVVVLVVATLRNPLLWRSQFVVEEAGVYWAGTFIAGPLEYLTDLWVGYLTMVSRAVFLVARLVPPEYAPALERTAECAIVAGVAAFFASGRLAAAIPDQRVRIAFGLSLAVLPTPDHMGSILQAHWILAIFLVGLSLTPERRWYDYPAAAVAVLSGLPAALAAPVFWFRGPDRLTFLVTALAVLQVGLALMSPRPRPEMSLIGIAAQIGAFGFVVAALAALSLTCAPRRPALAFAYLGLVTMAAGAVASGGDGGRYYVAAWTAVAFLVVTVAPQRRLAAVALAALFAGAAVASPFLGRVIPNTDWPSYARCIGSTEVCTVPMFTPQWTVPWPGDPARYELPPWGGFRS